MAVPVHLWQRAASFSARVHRHQQRKDGSTPYAAHPARVALTIATVFGVQDEAILAAALLHDVIEDCGVDYDEVAAEFGAEVASFVAAMSKDMRLPGSERERVYDEQLAAGPWQARLVKLGDVYDNFADAHDDRMRRRAARKVERALALADGDPRLERACAAVRALVGEVLPA